MISFNRAKLQKWAFILERMLHYGGSPYTTCTHNHDMRFPVYNISPPHSANAVITDTFHSTLTPQEMKLQHLLVEKMVSNPPPVDLEDLEIMQIETCMQHMMYGLGPYSYRAHKADFGLETSDWGRSAPPLAHDHGLQSPVLISSPSNDAAGVLAQGKPLSNMSAYDFLPPILRSVVDVTGAWD